MCCVVISGVSIFCTRVYIPAPQFHFFTFPMENKRSTTTAWIKERTFYQPSPVVLKVYLLTSLQLWYDDNSIVQPYLIQYDNNDLISSLSKRTLFHPMHRSCRHYWSLVRGMSGSNNIWQLWMRCHDRLRRNVVISVNKGSRYIIPMCIIIVCSYQIDMTISDNSAYFLISFDVIWPFDITNHMC